MGTIFYFLIVLGFAVTLHELGHFLVAKWSGVKVEKFSIGFGPKLLGFRKGETQYIVAPIPFGGYVKMAGDNPEEGAGDKPGDFFYASPWKRIGIVLAGPGMNFLLGYVIFFCIAYFPGAQVIRRVKVAVIEEHSLAEEAGLEIGDRITAVNGEEIRDWDNFQELVNRIVSEEEEPLRLEVQRDGQERIFTVDIDEASPIIGSLRHDMPAERAGLEVGGVVLSVEDQRVQTWEEMSDILAGRYRETGEGELQGIPTEIRWRAPDGDERSVTITPDVVRNDETRAVLGISRLPMPESGRFIDIAWAPDLWLGIRPWLDPEIGSVKKGSPAWEKGMRPGDLVVSVNGEPVDHWYEAAKVIYASYRILAPPEPEESGEEETGGAEPEREPVPLTITWMDKDGAHHTETMVPEVEWLPDLEGNRLDYAVIGVGPRKDRYSRGILESAVYAGDQVVLYCQRFIWVIKGVIFGSISPKAIGGPIAIARESGKQGAWGWESLFNLIAVLSVSFAVINLVPIPILDGGHVLVYMVEGIKGKRLTLRQMEIVQKIGLAILIPLIVLVFYNDLSRYIPFGRIGDFLKQLFQ
jgi:regulator of sigma E protease